MTPISHQNSLSDSYGKLDPVAITPEVYEGELSFWFETGTEGVVWILNQDGKSGYEAMVIIERGDLLTISGKGGELLFDGVIDPDHRVGFTPYREGEDRGQPCAHGVWIHWTQRGWTPEAWSQLFLSDSNRGRVVRAFK